MNARYTFPVAALFALLLTGTGLLKANARVVPTFDAKVERVGTKAALAGGTAWTSMGKDSAGGTVRVRATVGTKADVDLLVRGQLVAGEPSSGYLVRLAGKKLHLERLHEGRAIPLVEPESLRLPRRGDIELLVTHVGPHILARVYRVEGARHLASLVVTDTTHARGGMALRVGPGSSKRHRHKLKLVATRDACAKTPNPSGERGRAIWVTMPVEAYEGLSGVKAVLMERVGPGSSSAVYRFDSLDLEQALCQSASVERVSLDTPWKFLDRSYRRARHDPLGRGEERIPLDRSYKHPKMVRRILQAWADRFPDRAHLEVIGKSRQGRPIYAMAIGAQARPGGDAPTLLLNGAHHGNEPLSVDFVLQAADAMLHADPDSALHGWLDHRTVWVVPVVNPDGLHAFLEVTSRTGRKNGYDHDHSGTRERLEGVDLNRNYPFQWGELGEKGSRSRPDSVYYRGPAAGSEPEVRAMMRLADRERFSASISYHTGTVAVLAPYTIPGVVSPEPNEAWAVAEELVRAMPPHAQDRKFVVKQNLYAVDGTDQDWFRFAHGTVALLVEGARRTPSSSKARQRVVESVAPAWKFLLERFTEGRLLDIRVRDAEGHPVQAEVVITEMSPQAGERWTTRCPSGQVLRALPRPGTWTVEIRRADRPPVRRKIEVKDGPTVLVIDLEESAVEERCARPHVSE